MPMLAAAIVLMSVLLAVFIAWEGRKQPNAAQQADVTSAAPIEQDSRNSLRDRIIRESELGAHPQAEAVPMGPPINAAINDAAQSEDKQPPQPPDGYTFASHKGAMRQAPLRTPPDIALAPNPWWMESSTGTRRVMRQAVGMGRDWTFATMRIAPGLRSEDVEALLKPHGASVAVAEGEFVHVKVPASVGVLKAVQAAPGVLGLGVAPWSLKISPEFVTESLGGAPSEQVPVHISLLADDAGGEWQAALERMGVETGWYDEALPAYAAVMPMGSLEVVARADFVMSVEPVLEHGPLLDSAVPAIGADVLRTYHPEIGGFGGVTGRGISVGVVDSGLNIHHVDIHSGRDSICGANFVENDEGEIWADRRGHGTVITGVLAGRGVAVPSLAGVAPGVSHIRVAKVFPSHWGNANSTDIRRAMTFMSERSSCRWKGEQSQAVRPDIVNVSIGGRPSRGTGISTRKLDVMAHGFGQLYVVAGGNEGPTGSSMYSTAKSALGVGVVDDHGLIWEDSSHGPTLDGRLTPKLVAPGVNLMTVAADRNQQGYKRRSAAGSSLSSPMVAGVAALLMEAVPEFRGNPALARARLMASAIRPDAMLVGAEAFQRDNTEGPGRLQHRYGMGMLSARASLLSRDTPDGWVLGSTTSNPQHGVYEYVDIEVPEGASRLDVVMTWDEQPAAFISAAVLNDLDLWADNLADCGDGACGEHASQSRVDNVEWLFIQNPEPGVHRLKVVPHRVYGEPVNAALAWTIIRGDSTPVLEVEVNDLPDAASPDAQGVYEVTVSSSGYIANGVSLMFDDCPGDYLSGCGIDRIDFYNETRILREDGLSRTLRGVLPGHYESLVGTLALGEVAAGKPRKAQVKFTPWVSWSDDEAEVQVTAMAWNGEPVTGTMLVSKRASGRASAEAFVAGRAERVPHNDHFGNAAELPPLPEELPAARWIVDDSPPPTGERFDFRLTTREPGEHVSSPESRTLWYSWTAPQDGEVKFRVVRNYSGELFPLGISLYTGEVLATLDQKAASTSGEVTLEVAEGESYQLQLEWQYKPLTQWINLPLRLEWEISDQVAEEEEATADPEAIERAPESDQHIMDGSAASERPANDNFSAAQRLAGAIGSVSGTTERASLEASEFWGYAAASVWYEWTAPGDGYWIFDCDTSARVLVFTGDQLSRLRILSDPVRWTAVFPARSEVAYRVAVIQPDLTTDQGNFKCDWRQMEDAETDRMVAPNDLIENALELGGIAGQADLAVEGRRSIEYGEPESTAIRSLWWRWEAPRTGRYTWRMSANRFSQFVIFEGSSAADLVELAHGRREAVVDARQGAAYMIAVSESAEANSSYPRLEGSLQWGPSPENDARRDAGLVSGASGRIAGTLAFATSEPDEPSDLSVDRSVWWRWHSDEGGWHRFWVEGNPLSAVLSIHQGDGAGGVLERPLATSDWDFVASGRAQAHLLAEPGRHYDVRLARRYRESELEAYEVGWEKSEQAPAHLRYLGVANDTAQALAGDMGYTGSIQNLAMTEDGEMLFASSTQGILGFSRDASTGRLALEWLFDENDAREADDRIAFERGPLQWDSDSRRLILHRPHHGSNSKGISASNFRMTADRRALEYVGATVPVGDHVGDSYFSEIPVTVHLDSSRQLLYVLYNLWYFDSVKIRIFRENSLGEWTNLFVIRAQARPEDEEDDTESLVVPDLEDLEDIAVSVQEPLLYVATRSHVLVFSVNPENGVSSLVSSLDFDDLDEEGKPRYGIHSASSLVLDNERQLLFVAGAWAPEVAVFDLSEDRANPKFLDAVNEFHVYEETSGDDVRWAYYPVLPRIVWGYCDSISLRPENPAVEMHCWNGFYTVEWDARSGKLTIADWGAAGKPGRFGEMIPELWELSRSNIIQSPDQRHLYIGKTSNHISRSASNEIHVYSYENTVQSEEPHP